MEQSQSTQLDATVETGIKTDLIRTAASAAEQEALLPNIGGVQTLAASIAVSPASVELDHSDGETQQLTVVMTDDEGRTYTIDPSDVAWESADEAIATVDANGLVETVGDGGPIDITGTLFGKTDTCAVTVVA